MTRGTAQDWLAHAEADLRLAHLGQPEVDKLASLIAFHAQQAVEKALKAVLVSHGQAFPRTHDLDQLQELVEASGVFWPRELDPVLECTPFAVQGRYPGFDEPITAAEVAAAISMAEEVLAWAREAIGKPD